MANARPDNAPLVADLNALHLHHGSSQQIGGSMRGKLQIEPSRAGLYIVLQSGAALAILHHHSQSALRLYLFLDERLDRGRHSGRHIERLK